jgi:hypothetical protein
MMNGSQRIDNRSYEHEQAHAYAYKIANIPVFGCKNGKKQA